MKTLVIAPHPDDELLGCGGTLLKRSQGGSELAWLLVTIMSPEEGWSVDKIESRSREIESVRSGLGIRPKNLFQLDFPTTRLDSFPLGDIVQRLAEVFDSFKPEEIFLPHPNDAHSDHRVCYNAAMACSKWFRYPFLKKILTYETLSETDAMVDQAGGFRPTVFIDITDHLEKKWELIEIYKSEIGSFPFPRSELAVKALAHFRGAQAGFSAAEAFCLLREREVS